MIGSLASLTVSAAGARFGSHTSYQLPDANAAFGTPRGGRRTVPMRKPSCGNRAVPSRTILMAIAPQTLWLSSDAG